MAKRQPKKALQTEKRDGQISAAGGMQSFFLRNVPLWNPPAWQEADYWRRFVELQPIASICRDRIADYLNSLEWDIVAKDSDKQDELKGQIKHYKKLFEKGNAYYWDLDFSSHVEWFVKDLFTLPFGTASELGRIDDNPSGKVVWIRPLDAGTLAPTLNFDYPVVQSAPGTGINPVYFPRKYIARVYLSPRTELRREGWGYAPPERIALAIHMMSTGDNYYAKLLLDTPEAGILDLLDMEGSSAKLWIDGMRDLFAGINPLKVPVLYEHEKPAIWIPFGRPPSEIMYDDVTMRYAAILCSGYGLTLSDIGFPSSSSGGDTLAGTIRMERVGKSSGKSNAKKKWETYAARILPDSLKFIWIDYDDERNVSKGRARLASSQASTSWIRDRVFLPSEIRRQTVADGLFTINIPESIDPNNPEFDSLQPAVGAFGGSKTKTLGAKTSPSQGGQGEVIPQQVVQRNATLAEVGISKAVYGTNDILNTLLSQVQENLSQEEMGLWEEYVDGYLTGKSEIEEEELKSVLDDICNKAKAIIDSQAWTENISRAICEKVLEVEKTVAMDKALYRASQKAEEDFIEGKSDSLLAEEDVESIDLSIHAEDLYGVISNQFTILLSKYSILVAKSHILSGKLDVDSTEYINENIRISREISKDVLQNLSRIVHSVYEDGCDYLQKRIENAIS